MTIELPPETLERHEQDIPIIKELVDNCYQLFVEAEPKFQSIGGASLGFALSRLIAAILINGSGNRATADMLHAALIKSVNGCLDRDEKFQTEEGKTSL